MPASSYEHRIWSNHGTEGGLFGIAFYGEKGTLIIGEKGWRVEEGDGATGQGGSDGQAHHVQNFIDCVKSRAKAQCRHRDRPPEHPALPPGQHRFRTGKKLTFDAGLESFHDAQANLLLSREYSKRFEMPSHV